MKWKVYKSGSFWRVDSPTITLFCCFESWTVAIIIANFLANISSKERDPIFFKIFLQELQEVGPIHTV